MRRLAATLAALLAAAGCAGGDGREQAEQATVATESTSSSSGTATGSAPPVSPPASATTRATRPYQVWLHENRTNLELLWERGPVTKAAAATALRLLLAAGRRLVAPHDPVSSIPRGTRLLGIDLEDGNATVDLSAEFGARSARSALVFRAAQVVYTATQFPTVRRVSFHVEGRPYPVPAARGRSFLRRPVTRKDYEALLPPIVVESPPAGARVASPVVVSGTANVFEANVILRLVDRRGRELVRTFTTATCGSGCRGTFRGEIRFPSTAPRRALVVAEDDDADDDGFPSYAVRVPVRLVP
ncbi:MAG: GerMN domain-containing protein [Actinomycetota bacterium]|nr:GerMN domain-containing protein [Actinomycetota bacterium]